MTDSTSTTGHVAPGGFDSWNAYWTMHGIPWRTEPEIDAAQQLYLAERRAIIPDSEQGIYPFCALHLDRADVEWLLATHESGGMRGPVDWSDPSQRRRDGLDLRGVDLRGVDLSGLPLACVRAGLHWSELRLATPAQPEIEAPPGFDESPGLAAAIAHLEGAKLYGTHLENACLLMAQMQKVDAQEAHLEGAILSNAHLEGASLFRCHLEDSITGAANLEGALISDTHFERAFLMMARFGGSILLGARFDDADLRGVVFSDSTMLNGAWLGSERDGLTRLCDVVWGNVNVALVRWVTPHRQRRLSHDPGAPTPFGASAPEFEQLMRGDAPRDTASERLLVDQRTLRATRQVAVLLRNQGLHDQADRLAYHAQLLQRRVHRRQGRLGAYAFSLFLDALTGYGYRMGRILIAYGVVILGFATLFYAFGQIGLIHLQPTVEQSIVESLAAFHERVFSGLLLGAHVDPVRGWLTFAEAVSGLVIESTFIAMLVPRLRAGNGG